MRLIDADALECDTEWSEYHDGFISYSQLEIDTAPSIDIEPKRGEWVNTAEPYMSDNIVCSVCGYNSICEYNFCPNCGADMRGGEDR